MHRDLNVRANNERSWDYTLAPGMQLPQQPVQQLQPVLHTVPNGLPPAGPLEQPLLLQQQMGGPYGGHESLGSTVGMKRGRQAAGLGEPLHVTGLHTVVSQLGMYNESCLSPRPCIPG